MLCVIQEATNPSQGKEDEDLSADATAEENTAPASAEPTAA